MDPAVHAKVAPDRPAVIMSPGGARVTYAELDDRSARLATLFRRAGARRGDTVVLALPNDVRWAEVVWGCLRSGPYVAPLNWHLTAAELTPLMQDAAPRVVVTSAGLYPAMRAAVEAAQLALPPLWLVAEADEVWGGARPSGVLDHDLTVAETARDPELAETMGGRLLSLSAYLAEREGGEISVVYSSTQQRAGETARHIAERLEVRLHLDEALLEFDHGATLYTPIEQLKMGQVERWEALEHGRWGDFAFDLPRVRARVHEAIEGIVDRHPGTTVAVVCHGGVINSYLGEVLGAPRLMLFTPAYTSVTRIAAARSGHRQMRAVNETVHLDPLVAARILRHRRAAAPRSSMPDPFLGDCAVAPNTAPDEQMLPVLHILRLGGFVPARTISERIGLDEAVVETLLSTASDGGLVRERNGRISGWCLTAEGRTLHLELLAREVMASGAHAAIERLYERFLVLNEPFKEICTRWQMRTDATGAAPPNDHSDAAYDGAVIAELGALHPRTLSLTRDLAAELPRFARYEREFEAAWQRLCAGDRRAFTAPMSASYHDLWMELHQDLMCTLGRERTAADGH